MQAAPSPSPSPSPQQPPPQGLYNQRHLTNPITLQLASPDFATQTGGAKGALALTISVTPPFAHPPPLCRSSHSRGCPRCAPRFTCPAAHARLPSLRACRGAQEGQRAHPQSSPAWLRRPPSLRFMHPTPPTCLPPLRACRGRRRDRGGCAQGEGNGPGGMRARGRAACKGEGEGAGGMRARGMAARKGRGRDK